MDEQKDVVSVWKGPELEYALFFGALITRGTLSVMHVRASKERLGKV